MKNTSCFFKSYRLNVNDSQWPLFTDNIKQCGDNNLAVTLEESVLTAEGVAHFNGSNRDIQYYAPDAVFLMANTILHDLVAAISKVNAVNVSVINSFLHLGYLHRNPYSIIKKSTLLNSNFWAREVDLIDSTVINSSIGGIFRTIENIIFANISVSGQTKFGNINNTDLSSFKFDNFISWPVPSLNGNLWENVTISCRPTCPNWKLQVAADSRTRIVNSTMNADMSYSIISGTNTTAVCTVTIANSTNMRGTSLYKAIINGWCFENGDGSLLTACNTTMQDFLDRGIDARGAYYDNNTDFGYPYSIRCANSQNNNLTSTTTPAITNSPANSTSPVNSNAIPIVASLLASVLLLVMALLGFYGYKQYRRRRGYECIPDDLVSLTRTDSTAT